MKAKEIRELAINDLVDRIEAEKANLSAMRMNHAISPLENSSKLRDVRKNIARMITILHEKQLNDKK